MYNILIKFGKYIQFNVVNNLKIQLEWYFQNEMVFCVNINLKTNDYAFIKIKLN